MEFHPLANVFPLLEGAEFEALVEDVRTNGLLEPITTFEGQILDGRNRFRACQASGRTTHFRSFTGPDATAFVVSKNLARRHLNETQRAVVAAKLANLANGERKSASPIGEARVTQEEAAELLNVGKRSVERAREVLNDGAPELVREVERGTVSVSAAADVAKLPKEEQKVIVARGEREILEAAKRIRAERAVEQRGVRLEKIEKISAGNAPLITPRKYPIILADPPWRYENPPIGATSRAIENHYPTMTLEEICALPVRDIAAEDALLYLWATAPKLKECFAVIDAWGFEYRTNIVWVKDKIGMGYHARNQHELLLICKRGQMPPPIAGEQPSSVVFADRTEHSAKPPAFHEMIERLYPSVGKIELFSRSLREGWDAWGNQAVAA